MDIQKVSAYVGAGIAILFGVALLWIPPANLAGQAGTVGAAFSFVTGGLAAVGVTVTVPAIRAQAQREATATRRRARAPKPPAAPPLQ